MHSNARREAAREIALAELSDSALDKVAGGSKGTSGNFPVAAFASAFNSAFSIPIAKAVSTAEFSRGTKGSTGNNTGHGGGGC